MTQLIGWGAGYPPVAAGGRGTAGIDGALPVAVDPADMATPGYIFNVGSFQFAIMEAAVGRTVIVTHTIDRDGVLETLPQITLSAANPTAFVNVTAEAGVVDMYHNITAYDSATPDVVSVKLFTEVYVELDDSVSLWWWDDYIPPPPPPPPIAWGSPYYEGGTPGTAPFVPGASGSLPTVSFTAESFALGLPEDPGYATVSVAHMYAPADGGPEYLVATYSLYSGNQSVTLFVGENERDGLHTFTASSGYATSPTNLVLAITPDNNPGDNYYGAAAWYEEAAEPPVSVFWTRFINSKEVIE